MSDEKMIECIHHDGRRWLRGAFVNQLEKKKIDAFIREKFRSLMLMQERFQCLKTSNGKIVFVFINDQTEIGSDPFQCQPIACIEQGIE